MSLLSFHATASEAIAAAVTFSCSDHHLRPSFTSFHQITTLQIPLHPCSLHGQLIV